MSEETIVGIVEVSEQEIQILLESAYLSMEMGRFKEAQEIFEGCISLTPRHATPHIGLGNLFFSQDRYDEAVSSYQKALSMQPGMTVAHAFLGETYLFQGKEDLGIQSLQKAIDASPDGDPDREFAESLLAAHREGALV